MSGMAILLLGALLFTFMPESWHERMDSIYTYQEDESAMQRINSWQYSINVANDRLTGGGLQSWSQSMFAVYAPHPEWVFVAHSIYFSVLADHGWLGLIMFLLILGLTWRRLSVLIKRTKDEQNASFNLLARMMQVSLVAYMTGGIFLSLSYFDLPWHLIAIAMLLPQFLNKLEEGVSEGNPQNVAKASP
jgi:probable O-glycosylation ligase (exosortase A-associated)